MTDTLLPADFADLEPFAADWCLPTEPERWERRLDSSMDELQAFYDVCLPRVEEAIEHCDRFPLDDLPDDAAHLLELLLSFAMVSYPIEVWRQLEPVDTGSARIDRTREPRR